MWWHFLEIQEWVGLYQRFPVLSSRNRNTETLGLSLVSEPDSVSKFRPEESRNQSRNRNSDNQSRNHGLKKALYFSISTPFFSQKVPFLFKNRPFQVKISGIGIEKARLSVIIQKPDSEPESMFRIS